MVQCLLLTIIHFILLLDQNEAKENQQKSAIEMKGKGCII